MYGFLFDQTYINLIILGFFLFLIMFLWRKITIIEGNYFILEKRVDMIKKTERDSLISKNMEKADIVMNEIFKDSTSSGGGKKNFCNNVSYCPPDVPIKSQKNISKDSDDSKDTQDIDMSSYMIDAVKETANMNDVNIHEVIEDSSKLIKSKNDDKIEIIEYKNDEKKEPDNMIINKNIEYENVNINGNHGNDGNSSTVLIDIKTTDSDIVDVIYATSGGTTTIIDNVDSDAMSVSSDITFGTDQDKSIAKKYKKMSIEKLRDECIEKSLNSEGSKAILIGRILEYNKKI